jgi:carboxyl-terminal processing protease
MTRRAILVLAVIVVAAASLAGGLYDKWQRTSFISPESGLPDHRAFLFEEALSTAQENYAGQIDIEALGTSSIRGMLHTLDPHSAFFTKTQFDELQTETNSRIHGIGVTIVRRYDRVYIISTTPGGPGHRAGLRYGDAITRIDGVNVENWATDQVMHRVRGEKGAPVELVIERPGAPEPISVRLVREEVKLPTVRNACMYGDTGIGYIALTGGFSNKTEEELTRALAQLKEEGMRQLVLDLRGNPGGLLDQATRVAQKFLPSGKRILEVRGRDDHYPNRVYVVPDSNVPETMPLVLIVNNQTASASEVVAGALQDTDRALIVGENSFGKGLVQSVNRVWGGAGLTLTVAKYYTPSGRSIQRDYSLVSFYDYYLRRTEDGRQSSEPQHGEALRTDLGRPVFGGGGITPDYEVKPARQSSRLFFGIFNFVRQLTAGQIAGLREYKISETRHKSRLSSEDLARYPVTDQLIAALRQHLAAKRSFNVTDEFFNSKLDYIRAQLRREIMTAAFGLEVGEQAYLPEDVQFRKAVESLDQARMLADNARRAMLDRQ